MMGPLGLLSPHPGVSYLFTGTDTAPTNDGESTLWGIANAAGASAIYAGALGSPPPSWNSALGDSVRQIDGKLKVRVSCTCLTYSRGADILHQLETYRSAPQGARRLRANRNQRRTGVVRPVAAQRRGARRGARAVRLRRMSAPGIYQPPLMLYLYLTWGVKVGVSRCRIVSLGSGWHLDPTCRTAWTSRIYHTATRVCDRNYS